MLTVSNYHYIRENFDAEYPSIFGITPSDFRKQLLLLKQYGKFVSATELLENTEAILSAADNFILITFDDGLKEQASYALPVLDELGIPAVFFANSINCQEKKVTTVHKIHLLRSMLAPEVILENLSGIETTLSDNERKAAISAYRYDDVQSACLKYMLNFKISFNLQESAIKKIFDNHFDEQEVFEKLYMDEETIRSLAKKNYLGSHTHHHYPIGLLNPQAIRFELEHSKQYFENLTGSAIEMLSYPYGTPEACTPEVVQIAKASGYKIGFTTQRGDNSNNGNPLLLNRHDCNDLPGGKNYKE